MSTRQSLENAIEALWKHAENTMRKECRGFGGVIGRKAIIRDEYLPGYFAARDVPVWSADVRLFTRFDPSI